MSGPDPGAAERYAELPSETREFLERLRPDEILALSDFLAVLLALLRLGRLGRVALWAVLTSLILAAGGIEALGKLKVMVGGWLSWLGK